VFAIDRFIFHIHGDRQSAILNVSRIDASLGKDSNFETMDAHRAQQWPAQPVNLADRGNDMQLDCSSVGMPACHLNSNLGDEGGGGGCV
jgi:hypothetical protein